MAETFELEVVTPERQLVKEQVEEAQIPGKEGYLGVLPGHAPLLTELGTGFMYYVTGGKRRYLSDPRRLRGSAAGPCAAAGKRQRARGGDRRGARPAGALERAQHEMMNPALGVDPAAALNAIARAEARLQAAAQK